MTGHRGQVAQLVFVPGSNLLLVLSIFALPASLSEIFRFPNVRGDLVYLPGMLIIGIGYYFCMAVFAVLHQAAARVRDWPAFVELDGRQNKSMRRFQ